MRMALGGARKEVPEEKNKNKTEKNAKATRRNPEMRIAAQGDNSEERLACLRKTTFKLVRRGGDFERGPGNVGATGTRGGKNEFKRGPRPSLRELR